MTKSFSVKLDTTTNKFNLVLSQYCVLAAAIDCPNIHTYDSITYEQFTDACSVMFASLKESLCEVYDELKELNRIADDLAVKELQNILDENNA